MSLTFERCSYAYGRSAPVLNRFSLEIPSGCTVLLGPNGAGKSTLMSVGASWLKPASGKVTWRSLSPSTRRDLVAYRKAVGWLPQNVTAMPGLTVREQAAYVGWLKGVSRRDAWDASAQALSRVRLRDLSERKSHQLSGGQLRRLGIAGALVHRSEILLLDEPTAGLDPSQRQVFRELLGELREGVQVVVSTHQTEDLSDIYDHVIVLESGTVRYQGGTEGFLSMAPSDTVPGRQAEGAYTRLIQREA
ncbi:ATP-binding cassette domain-containing protein [Streptomyces chattanoogensis]|uniref:ABC transporter n=1 Tax=Streptomyces chattanoogensis TaxID=66876 RepID=A0A0N1JW61_9ACTN|nr:ATP-binding cassette domain-containing protein [Streptomyces chattanoogensis]KPC59524.1 ABC transporter [Streptomyces chattanoogensis]